MHVVLLTPPVVRAVEPMLGVATLHAYLRAHDVPVTTIDANVLAQDWILRQERVDEAAERVLAHPDAPKSAKKRARAWRSWRPRFDRYLRGLRGPDAYADPSRYRTTVTSLNHAAALVGAAHDLEAGSPVQLSLSNYDDARYCDMDAASVREAADAPEHSLFDAYTREELLPRLREVGATLVGISVIFRSQLLPAVALAARIRRDLPGVHVVMGGELISAWAEQLPSSPLMGIADTLLPYEGEVGLLALARTLASEHPDLSTVPNLVWRDASGHAHRNPTAKVQSLAEVPTPDYSFAPWDLYFAPERTAPLVAARGCYWNRCTFCPEVINPERLLRMSSAERLFADLEALHETHGVTKFHFIDSAIPPRVMRDLATLIVEHERPYTWFGFSRLEPMLGKDGVPELLAAGGCRLLKLGLESGSQRLLDAMDKRQRLESVSHILRRLRSSQILVHAFLMFGTPLEEERDAEATLSFVKAHADEIQFLNCSLMNLAHGSPMAEAPESHGITRVRPFEIPGRTLDLALYSNFDAVGWGRVPARRFLHKRFLSDPDVRPLHTRTPAHFDSNHSVFFHGTTFAPGDSR